MKVKVAGLPGTVVCVVTPIVLSVKSALTPEPIATCWELEALGEKFELPL